MNFIIKRILIISIIFFLIIISWYFYNQKKSIIPNQIYDMNLSSKIDFYKKNSFEEHILGNPDAKVTIIEYSSLTCTHCANFHINVFNKLKKEYIKTGKIKFIYRDFYLNDLSRALAMIAQCAPKNQYFSVINLILTNQKKWISAQKPFAEVSNLLKLLGYSNKKITSCIKNNKIINGIIKDHNNAENIGIKSTPTIFINNIKQNNNNLSYKNIKNNIEKLLKK